MRIFKPLLSVKKNYFSSNIAYSSSASHFDGKVKAEHHSLNRESLYRALAQKAGTLRRENIGDWKEKFIGKACRFFGFVGFALSMYFGAISLLAPSAFIPPCYCIMAGVLLAVGIAGILGCCLLYGYQRFQETKQEKLYSEIAQEIGRFSQWVDIQSSSLGRTCEIKGQEIIQFLVSYSIGDKEYSFPANINEFNIFMETLNAGVTYSESQEEEYKTLKKEIEEVNAEDRQQLVACAQALEEHYLSLTQKPAIFQVREYTLTKEEKAL